MVHPELRVRGACTHTHPYVAIHMLAYCSINLCVWLYSDEGYQYIDMFEEDGMYNVYLCLYHYMYLWMCWCSVSWLFVRYANKYKVSVCTHLDVYHCVSGDCFCSLVYFMCLLWQRICATSVHLIPGKWDQSGGIRASKSECVDVYGLLCGTYLRVCGMSK